MNSKYTTERKYRDFIFVDPEDPAPKRSILLKTNKKGFWRRIIEFFKNKY